jgi:hypothetical protein
MRGQNPAPPLPKTQIAFDSSGANAPPLKSVAKKAAAQQHRPMLASLITHLMYWRSWLGSPFTLIVSAFHLWMLIHAIRNREWFWVVFILVAWGLGAIWYYLYVYRASATRGFELPGAQKRRRIRELQAQIHHLDKAHHHSQLGDIYFSQGKLPQAEASYRAALERDSQDIDTRAHLGQCLLRAKRAEEARPLLEGVVAENPKHDYGYSLMALAENLMALGETDGAMEIWKRVTENHSYPRAKVQLAEILAGKGNSAAAKAELHEVVSDDTHAPAFQRKRDRYWIRRAKAALRKL